MKLFSIFRHAFQMVWRMLRSYAMLSVTIVLSFSFLLGYMAFMDAQLYNKYKEWFALRRGDVFIEVRETEGDRMQLLREKLEGMENTVSYVYYHGLLGQLRTSYTLEGQDADSIARATLGNWQLYLVPDYAWEAENLFDIKADGVFWLDGREDFTLAEDECLINQQLFYALELDQDENPVYTFPFTSIIDWKPTFRIAGYIKSDEPLRVDDRGYLDYDGSMANCLVISAKHWNSELFNPSSEAIKYIHMVIHSQQPEAVAQLAYQLGMRDNINTIYDMQNTALEHIRTQKQTKALITCALLLLLGINLYSSFSNALNERKFEIGVKRAIGASSWSIVRQFLYESLIVMLANILLSVALVVDGLIVYKYIYEHTPNELGTCYDWVLYVSPYTIFMFGICAVSLTVVFSLIFAYKSTQVEIVQYLKAE